MTRLVLHSAHGPQPAPKATSPGDNLYVCRCGLSASPLGLCDGSHKATLDEEAGFTYLYQRKDGVLHRAVQSAPFPTPSSLDPPAPTEAPIQQ